MPITKERDIHDTQDEPINQEMQGQLHAQLLAARDRLYEELRRENAERAGSDNYGNLTNAVPDPGDASVASEQADLRHAQIGRDVAELRQIEAALGRIEDGSYGVCSVCGLDIAAARLQASPAAERCIVCQSAFEKQYADPGATAITRKV
jgi:RNA polymerase-binding protein DksA